MHLLVKPTLDLKPLTGKLGITATISLMAVLLHTLLSARANLLLYVSFPMPTGHDIGVSSNPTTPPPACLGATGIRDPPHPQTRGERKPDHRP